MSQTPMERWTPRERREFEAQMIVAQRHERRIGDDVDWRGLHPTILSISEIPSFARRFVWDIRRDDDGLKLFVSAGRTAGSTFLAPGYRQQAVDPADVQHTLTSIAATRIAHWHPAEPYGGVDGTTYEVTLRSGLSHVRWCWWGHGPPEWQELTSLVPRLIMQFKQADLLPNPYALDPNCDARIFFEESARDTPFMRSMPFSERRSGVHVAAGLGMRGSTQTPRLVLAVYAAAMTDDVRLRILQGLTVGAVDDIVGIVREDRAGIPIVPISNPARLPRDADAAYFELDRTLSDALSRLDAVAIRVAPGLPTLRMELWAVTW